MKTLNKRSEAENYLKCRMEHGLMSQEDFSKLGYFGNNEKYKDLTFKEKERKQEEGFIAGKGFRKK